jgi:hypothetical protein
MESILRSIARFISRPHPIIQARIQRRCAKSDSNASKRREQSRSALANPKIAEDMDYLIHRLQTTPACSPVPLQVAATSDGVQ